MYSLEEITEVVTEKGGGSLKIGLISGERFAVYSTRCRQIYAMLNAFLREAGSIGKSRGVVCIVCKAIILFCIQSAGKIDLIADVSVTLPVVTRFELLKLGVFELRTRENTSKIP